MKRTKSGFTLIELLVVVAIISILISILLPGLNGARKQARKVVCGANQRSIGQAANMYGNENGEWIPGVPFGSGLACMNSAESQWYTDKPDATVAFDWATPLMRYMNYTKDWHRQVRMYDSRLGPFRCAENDKISIPWPSSGNFPAANGLSNDRFLTTRTQLAQSYLTTWKMLLAGNKYSGKIAGTVGTMAIPYMTYPTSGYETALPIDYLPKFGTVGNNSRKIFVMDGVRYVDSNTREITYNPALGGTLGSGSYSGTGPVYKYSVEYSAQRAEGAVPEAPEWSYRHGTGKQRGVMALFFDGHTEYLSEKQTRNLSFTAPTGSTLVDASDLHEDARGPWTTRVGENLIGD